MERIDFIPHEVWQEYSDFSLDSAYDVIQDFVMDNIRVEEQILQWRDTSLKPNQRLTSVEDLRYLKVEKTERIYDRDTLNPISEQYYCDHCGDHFDSHIRMYDHVWDSVQDEIREYINMSDYQFLKMLFEEYWNDIPRPMKLFVMESNYRMGEFILHLLNYDLIDKNIHEHLTLLQDEF